MDMRQFAGSRYVTVDDLRDGPREEVIAAIALGKYDKPDATFASGDMLGLNKTNVNILIKNYGEDGRDWIGCTIELYVGPLKYNGGVQDGVLVRPISPPKPVEARTPVPKTPPNKNDMSDDIPF